MSEKLLVVDATDGILGRIAGFAAKQSLLGKTVKIINCNEAIITGRKREIIENYKIKRARGGSSLKGPNFPKSPERIMKRTVRGMLSYKQGRGRDALKRVICFNEIPQELDGKEKTSMKRDLKVKGIKLKELSGEI